MKQFTMRLNRANQRPIAILKEWHKFSAMIDTGALYPVWVEDTKILDRLNAEKIDDEIRFGGFGGDAYGAIYKIPYFRFGELIYPGLHIIAHRMHLPCQMIVSATMLQDMIYEIDDKNHRMNVTIPDDQSNVRNVRIRREDGLLKVLCSSGE